MKDIKFERSESEFLRQILTATDNGTNTKFIQKIIKKLENGEKTIKVSSRKGKGRGLQYKICEMIADKFGVKFDQNDPDCEIHSREMGQHGTDIVLRGKIRRQFPFSIECKAQENLSIVDWVRQARDNQEDGKHWMLIFKKQTIGPEPLVCMDFETFLNIYQVVEDGAEESR